MIERPSAGGRRQQTSEGIITEGNYMGKKMVRELRGKEAHGARADDPQKTVRDTRRQMLLHHIRSPHLGTTFPPLECDTKEFCQGSEGSKGIVDGGKRQFGQCNRQQNKESCGSGRAAGRSSWQERRHATNYITFACLL